MLVQLNINFRFMCRLSKKTFVLTMFSVSSVTSPLFQCEPVCAPGISDCCGGDCGGWEILSPLSTARGDGDRYWKCQSQGILTGFKEEYRH